ncbi:MAG TPA: hypothetical protein ENJ95_05700 [Bacteroidetes bacterium]|nr:hypothetical protein [Bacteroidota bacterium]
MKLSIHQICCFLTCLAMFSCTESSSNKETPESTSTNSHPKFELLNPSETGISFKNIVQEQSNINYFNANYLYIGGGVGVGDFNNDGLSDLYFVAVTGENKLYLNRGNFKFEDVTQKAGIGLNDGVKTGVSVVDINADGWLDIYQCRTGQDRSERGNKLFVNQGDGTFKEESKKYGLDTYYASTEANFFDYDLDGDLDMYLINRPVDFSTNNKVFVERVNGVLTRTNRPKDDMESDRLFRNNGNNTFTDVSAKAGIENRAFSLSVNILDVNEDGYPDIYVANDYIEPDHFYINQGNGTFVDEWERYLRHLCHFSMGADVADVNNDGLFDIINLDMLPPDNYLQKQNGTTMKWDRYKSTLAYGFGHQIMRNMFQLNNGKGSFQEVACLTGMEATDWSWAPMIADFDNDGWKDVFITNGMKKDVNDLDFANFVMDSLRTAGVPVDDFSKLLKFIPSHKPSNYMFRNSHDLKMENVTKEWGLGQKTFSNGAAYVDLDNDGDLDLVVHNTDDPAAVYKNTTRETGGGNYLEIQLKGPANNPLGAGAKVKIRTGDLTQVVEKQLNRGFLSAMDQPLHFGLGDKTAIDEIEVVWPGKKMQVLQNIPANQMLAVQYADADRAWQPKAKPKVPCKETTATAGLDYQHLENNFEDFDRERLVHRKYSARGPALAVGDLNGDGLEDVFIGGTFYKKGTTFIQTKPGKFKELEQPAFAAETNREDVGATFFDANGDGVLDLYIVSGGEEAPTDKRFYLDRLFINNGKGLLQPYPGGIPNLNANGSCVKAFDFDRDGDMDLAVGGSVVPGQFPRTTKSYLLKNEKGVFVDVTDQFAPGFADLGIVNAIEFADLNGDSRPEMIVAGEWMNVTVFDISPQGMKEVTGQFGLANTEGWWNCLQVADLNGDGFKDIIAGNLGLNCRLHASPEEPLEVYAFDIDQNGSIDPVFSYFNGGKRYPLAHRDMLISQVSLFKKKFNRYRTYSKATFNEVIPVEQQEKALKLKAGMLSNSVFWGSAGGRFTRADLPPMAQVAPIMDMALRDVNGDGLLDVIAVGNDYGLEVESGRMDAGDGWVILGEKNKNLIVVPNAKTGFWSSGNARSVETVSLKNSSGFLILVGNNNAAAQVFEWTGRPVF